MYPIKVSYNISLRFCETLIFYHQKKKIKRNLTYKDEILCFIKVFCHFFLLQQTFYFRKRKIR